MWRHTRLGDMYVSVIIDPTPVPEKTGPAWLLDMVEGRLKDAFKDWLVARPKPWREKTEVVAMDGSTGFKTVAKEPPEATPILDPFHVDPPGRWRAGELLPPRPARSLRPRGTKGNSLYAARRTLLNEAGLFTDKQQALLDTLLADDRHTEIEAT